MGRRKMTIMCSYLPTLTISRGVLDSINSLPLIYLHLSYRIESYNDKQRHHTQVRLKLRIV